MTKPTNRGQILRDWITYRVKIQCKQLDNAIKMLLSLITGALFTKQENGLQLNIHNCVLAA